MPYYTVSYSPQPNIGFAAYHNMMGKNMAPNGYLMPNRLH